MNNMLWYQNNDKYMFLLEPNAKSKNEAAISKDFISKVLLRFLKIQNSVFFPNP